MPFSSSIQVKHNASQIHNNPLNRLPDQTYSSWALWTQVIEYGESGCSVISVWLSPWLSARLALHTGLPAEDLIGVSVG